MIIKVRNRILLCLTMLSITILVASAFFTGIKIYHGINDFPASFSVKTSNFFFLTPTVYSTISSVFIMLIYVITSLFIWYDFSTYSTIIWKNSKFRNNLFFTFSFFNSFRICKDFCSLLKSLRLIFKNHISNFTTCFIFSCSLASFTFIHFNSESSRTQAKCRTEFNNFTHNFSVNCSYSSTWIRKNDCNMQIEIRLWKAVFNFLGTFYAHNFHFNFAKQFFRKFKVKNASWISSSCSRIQNFMYNGTFNFSFRRNNSSYNGNCNFS